MTFLDRAQFVQVGIHASVTDVTSLPGTLVALEPDEMDAMPRDLERIERDLMRGDALDYSSILGTKGLEEIPISLPMRGIATNDGGALDAQTELDCGLMLDSLFGASTDKSGAATTITGDTGSTGTLTVTSGTNLANGGGVLFMDGNGDYIAREIASGGGTGTLVMDRDHTDGAPGSDNVPYGSCYWTLAPLTADHTHLFIRGIGTGWERSYFGCIGQLSLEVREKLPVRFNSRWLPNNWTDTTVGPSFSAPTAGNYIMGINSRLWIGADADAILVKSVNVNFGYTIAPRESISGVNGQVGYIVTRKQPVIEGLAYLGSNGLSFGEVADSSGNISVNRIQGLTNSSGSAANAGEAASTYDIGLQVGARPGGTMYVRVPAGEFSGRVVKEGGIEMIRFQIKPRRPSAGSPLRLHVF